MVMIGAEETEFKESKDVETIGDPDFPKTPFDKISRFFQFHWLLI